MRLRYAGDHAVEIPGQDGNFIIGLRLDRNFQIPFGDFFGGGLPNLAVDG